MFSSRTRTPVDEIIFADSMLESLVDEGVTIVWKGADYRGQPLTIRFVGVDNWKLLEELPCYIADSSLLRDLGRWRLVLSDDDNKVVFEVRFDSSAYE